MKRLKILALPISILIISCQNQANDELIQKNLALRVQVERASKRADSLQMILDYLSKSDKKELSRKLERKDYDLELIKYAWNHSESGRFTEMIGQVKNISDKPLRNVQALVTFYDAKKNFIVSEYSTIEFNPIMPGQLSPFRVTARFNPLMKTANIEFKYLMGGKIATFYN